MNISGINSLSSALSGGIKSPVQEQAALPFQSLFEDAVSQVRESQQASSQEIAALATGETDDVHNLMIASAKSTVSVMLLVQMRNQALEAYNELMRTSL